MSFPLSALSRAGVKLREANQQQQFNRNVEDIELWLYEVEGHLASDDYGKDLTNVQNLQKKHALLEADVAAHQVRGVIFLLALLDQVTQKYSLQKPSQVSVFIIL